MILRYLLVIFPLVFILSSSIYAADSLEVLLLQKRASMGYSADEYLYGRTLILGNYPFDKKMEGIRYLKKAALSGYEPAVLFLAEMYEKGIGGVKINFVEAYKWYKKGVDMGIEVAKIKLAPLKDLTNSTKKGFRLFGLVLKNARRFAVRYVLQKNGAVPLKVDDNSFCDIFRSDNLVNGTDKVQVCFGPDKTFAMLEYRYPPRPTKYELILADMLKKLKKKYGNPNEIRTNNLIDRYVWQQKDITIFFWIEPKTNTCFLRYVEPGEYEKLYAIYRAQKEKNKMPKIEFF